MSEAPTLGTLFSNNNQVIPRKLVSLPSNKNRINHGATHQHRRPAEQEQNRIR